MFSYYPIYVSLISRSHSCHSSCFSLTSLPAHLSFVYKHKLCFFSSCIPEMMQRRKRSLVEADFFSDVVMSDATTPKESVSLQSILPPTPTDTRPPKKRVYRSLSADMARAYSTQLRALVDSSNDYPIFEQPSLMDASEVGGGSEADLFGAWQTLREGLHTAVVAIDFGTSGTGMIIALDGQLKSPEWDDEREGRFSKELGRKIPSCALFNPARQLIAYGQRARMLFEKCEAPDGSEINKTWLFFEHYKMDLHRIQNTDDLNGLEIAAMNGQRMKMKNVLIQVMRYLRNTAMLCLSNNSRLQDSSKVSWVITVPAIWAESSKQIMRNCARMAGMGAVSEQCVLLYEPEAAAIAIHKQWSDEIGKEEKEEMGSTSQRGVRTMENNGQDLPSMQSGDRYMIVDCGGGTIDIVTHEWLAPFEVCEVIAPDGGPWGSRCVDAGMDALFTHIFGADSIISVKKGSPSVWSFLMRECIKAKEMFHKRSDDSNKESESDSDDDDSDEEEEPMHFITLPEQFVSQLGKKTIKRAVKAFGKGNARIVGSGQLSLGISEEWMRRVFDKPVSELTYHLKRMIEDNREVLLEGHKQLKRICLVGGFAESKYLERRVREAVSEVDGTDNVRVWVSDRPSSAVMTGAASLDHIRRFVKGRVLKYSYGYLANCMRDDVEREWANPPRRDELDSRTFRHEFGPGDCELYVMNCFRIIHSKGSLVRPGTIVERTLYPSASDQTEGDCTVYFSKDHSSEFLLPLDESDLQKCAVGGKCVEYPFPEWFDEEQGRFVLTYEFATEIELKVTITFHSPGHDPMIQPVELFQIE